MNKVKILFAVVEVKKAQLWAHISEVPGFRGKFSNFSLTCVILFQLLKTEAYSMCFASNLCSESDPLTEYLTVNDHVIMLIKEAWIKPPSWALRFWLTFLFCVSYKVFTVFRQTSVIPLKQLLAVFCSCREVTMKCDSCSWLYLMPENLAEKSTTTLQRCKASCLLLVIAKGTQESLC